MSEDQRYDEPSVEPRSDEAAEQPRSYGGDLAVPVEIVKDSTPEKVRSATFGGWQSYRFVGTESVPVQLLRFDERRRRAVIQGLPGFVTDNINGNLWIGSEKQIGNGNPAGAGAILVSGMVIEVQSASELWCIPDGVNELTVTVLDEIYRD